MSRAALTMYVWTAYLVVLSTTLLLAPNALLRVFGLPETNEVWVRIVGMLLTFLAYLSLVSARTENTAYMRWSGQTRATVILFFGAFVAAGLAPPVLLLFGGVDLIAAVWTLSAIARDAGSMGREPERAR